MPSLTKVFLYLSALFLLLPAVIAAGNGENIFLQQTATVSDNGGGGTSGAAGAVDGDSTTFWQTGGPYTDIWLVVQLGTSTAINTTTIEVYDDTFSLLDFDILGTTAASTNCETGSWTQLYTLSRAASVEVNTTTNYFNNVSYRSYCLNISSANDTGVGGTAIKEWTGFNLSNAAASVFVPNFQYYNVFLDNFTRPNNNTVGNGWVEFESGGSVVDVVDNNLVFTQSSPYQAQVYRQINLPAYHALRINFSATYDDRFKVTIGNVSNWNATPFISVSFFDNNIDSVEHYGSNVCSNCLGANGVSLNNYTQITLSEIDNATWSLLITNVDGNYSAHLSKDNKDALNLADGKLVFGIPAPSELSGDTKFGLFQVLANWDSVLMRFIDEETNSLILQNVNLSVIPDTQTARSYNSSTGLINVTSLLPDFYEFRYVSAGYDPRSYFLNVEEDVYGNTHDLYLLNKDVSTNVLATVYDENEDALPNVLVRLLKFFVNESAYKTVEMIRTDFNGQNPFNLQANSQSYQFLIERLDGTVLFRSSTDTKITGTSINFKVNTEDDLFKEVKDMKNVVYSLDYNNNTDILTLTYTDNSGTTTKGCVILSGETTSNNLFRNTTCVDASSGTLVLNLSNLEGDASATAFFESTNGNLVVAEIRNIFSQDPVDTWGTLGIFLMIFVVGTISLANIISPEHGIIMTIAGIIVISMLEFTVINKTIVSTLAVTGLIIAYIASRK